MADDAVGDVMEIPAAILAERERQITGEGFDSRHDDEHVNGELLAVARMYWQRAIGVALPMQDVDGIRVPVGFPWDAEWWKPKTSQRDLERAGALCLAEIDRRRRADVPSSLRAVEEQLALIVSAYRSLPSWVPK